MLSPVRDGYLSVFECPDCGCRLNLINMAQGSFVHHFMADEGKDARGCECESVGAIWVVNPAEIKHLQ